MGPPNRSKAVLVGGSLYNVNEATGRLRHEISGPRALRSLIELNPFLSKLYAPHRHELIQIAQPRMYQRNHQLRGSTSSMVHIVLSGCVAEEPTYGEANTMRIQGTGAVLGDVEIFNSQMSAPTTRCLNATSTMSIPLERMRALAENNATLAMALGHSITERIAVGERVYNRHTLPPEQRLAGLFMYLLEHCPVSSRMYGRMLEGPSQTDLATALSVSRATIEGAVRTLRTRGVVITGYRTYEFPSERKLAEIGKVRIPTQVVTGESSER